MATTVLPSYTYRELNRSDAREEKLEIRLVDILPGQGNAPLECEITIVNLADNPEYEALSYTWGTGGLTSEVRIHGTESPAKLPITTSLYSIMQRLRLKQSRRIWIDQICINLSNILERNHQVQFMKKIYWNAKRVVIDLGDGTEQSDIMFDHVSLLDDTAQLERDWICDGAQAIQPLRGVPTDVLQSTSNVLLRPWFQRVWVLQEVALALDILVCCGSRTVTWSQLFAFVLQISSPSIARTINDTLTLKWLSENSEDAAGSIASAIRMIQFTTRTRRSHGIFNPKGISNLVLRHRDAQASDSRDKIFGLLGLAPDEITSEITVDYSTDVNSIYRTFASTILESGDIYLLNHAGIAHASGLELPSWVPDWSNTSQYTSLEEWIYIGADPGPHIGRVKSAPSDKDIIYIWAAIVDQISSDGGVLECFARDSLVHGFASIPHQRFLESFNSYLKGAEFKAWYQNLVGGDVSLRDPTEDPLREPHLEYLGKMSLFHEEWLQWSCAGRNPGR